MYISKRKAECLNVLALRLKVASKRCGMEGRAQRGGYTAWRDAESAQDAIAYVLGDLDALDRVEEQERCTLDFYGIKVEGE